ncbi:MAG: DUF2760 domain-containing protein [Oligoflexales bacterium]
MKMLLASVMCVVSVFLVAGAVKPEWMFFPLLYSSGFLSVLSILLLGCLLTAKSTSHVADFEDENSRLKDENDAFSKALSAVEKELNVLRKDAQKGAKEARDSKEFIYSFLGLLQKEGRFLDFVMDDVAQYSDEEIGAAARLVHQGCHRLMDQYFQIQAVEEQAEGSRISLTDNYDANHYKVVGSATLPCQGVLTHAGWKVMECSLPQPVGKHHFIMAQAEVEVGGVM